MKKTLHKIQRDLEDKFFQGKDEIYWDHRGYTPDDTINCLMRALDYAHWDDQEDLEGDLFRCLEEFTKEVYTPWKKEQLHRKLLRKIRKGKTQFFGDHAIGYPEMGAAGDMKFLVVSEGKKKYVSEEEFIELFL